MKPSSQENIFHCVLCNLLFVETCYILNMCLECSVDQFYPQPPSSSRGISTFTASLPHVCFPHHHIQTREQVLAAFQQIRSIKTYFALLQNGLHCLTISRHIDGLICQRGRNKFGFVNLHLNTEHFLLRTNCTSKGK